MNAHGSRQSIIRRLTLVASAVAALLSPRAVRAQDAAQLQGYVPLHAGATPPAPLAVLVDVRADSVPLAEVARDIARQARLNFTWEHALPGLDARITLHMTRVRAADALLGALEGSPVLAVVSPSGHVVLVRRAAVAGDGPLPPMVVRLDSVPVLLSAVVVTPGYFGMMGTALDAPQTLDREQIRTRPQLGEDLFRSINRLAGLSSNDIAAGFHVRGGEVNQLYVSLDGLQLHEPFHLKDVDGALSILDMQSVEGIELTTGGFTSEYGSRLGSVLTIQSAAPRLDTITTMAGLSITNVRAQSEGSFGDGKGGWLVSARRGYLDLALRLAGTSDSLSPVYSDLFAKGTWDFDGRHRIAVHALRADDAMHYSSGDGVIRSGYTSTYGWLNWDAAWTDALESSTVLSASALSWTRDGTPHTGLPGASQVHDHRSFDATPGLRQDWTLALGDQASVRWGGEVQAERASYDYDGMRAVITGTGSATAVVERHIGVGLSPSGTHTGFYLTPRVRPVSWLVVEAGARYDGATWAGDAIWSPRVNVRIALDDRTFLRLAVGRYTQSQDIYALQVQDSVTRFAPSDIATHRVIGLERRIAGATTLRVEAYERAMTRERSRYVNLASTTNIFPEVEPDRVFIASSSGLARGVDVIASRRAATGVEWSASYTLARVFDRVNGIDLPRPYDQRHTGYIDASYRPTGASWRISMAWQFHSGWPAPAVAYHVDTIPTAGGGHQIFIVQDVSSLPQYGAARIPWYRRADVRFTRDVDTGHGRLSFFADVFNVFNAANPRGYNYNYSFDGTTLRVVPRPNAQIPILPSAGFSWEF